MLPLLLAAATGGAVLYTGFKRQQTAKKSLIQQLNTAPPKQPIAKLAQARANVQARVQKLANQVVQPLVGAERAQHFAELASADVVAANQLAAQEEGQQEQLYLGVSLLSLGLTLTGRLLYPPLVLLSLPGLLYTTYPFIKAGYDDLWIKRKATASTLDLILLPGVLLLGDFVVLSFTTSVLALAHLIVHNMEDRSLQSVVNVFGKQPMTVWVLADGNEVEIPFNQLQRGDLLVVGAGQMIPADGQIVQGIASIDQRLLTGEAQPAEKGVGEPVLAATLVLAGRILVQVERTGEATLAAKIGNMLAHTAAYKQTFEIRSTTLGDRWVSPTLCLAALTAPIRGLMGGLALLLTSPGYDLRILGPLSMLNFLRIAAQSGVLVKNAQALERLSTIDTLVFDKTGTLTLEQPQVHQIHAYNSWPEATVLRYAAAAEQRQTHPIARAILAEAQARGLNLPALDEARYEVGYGIKVTLEEQLVRIGSTRFLTNEGIPLPPPIADLHTTVHARGHSLVLVSIGEQLAGAIELQPMIRPEARQIVTQLKEHQRTLYIISGDQEQPTRTLAESLGIDHYFANVLPEQKANLVKQLQAEGKKVCFVGDGINDAIALQQADVSISLRGAATVATDTAQIVLMSASLQELVQLFALGDHYTVNMQRNYVICFIPSIVTLGGVFLLHFGVASALAVYSMGLLAGLANSMTPLLRTAADEEPH